MDYSLLVGIHDTEHVDTSGAEDELDGDEEFETGEDSGDGLDESTNCDDIDSGRQYKRTESVTSNDVYESELYSVPCSDGQYCFYTVFSLNEK